MSLRSCRFCGSELGQTFCDLGMSPLANSYLDAEQLSAMEPFYPLHAYVCSRCFLVQLAEFEPPERIFSDYAYFSSYSDSWLRHAREYAERVARQLSLGPASQVIEIGSNDGYLLKNFVGQGIPALGIEPAANVAAVAERAGVRTLVRFFGSELARELAGQGIQADLIVGNNVLAHVPALNDFVRGLRLLLRETGVITLEFPHLLRLIREQQFDTIYHEHFSYFSLLTAERVLSAAGLRVFDVEELGTHGGSLRVYACHGAAGPAETDRLARLRDREEVCGLNQLATYAAFAEVPKQAKRHLLAFLIQAAEQGSRIVGYGAAAKANTLLNYCGVGPDFIEFVADRSREKQGRFLPGSHIPIRAPEQVAAARPDYLLILAWNLRDEITDQMQQIREWGGRFVVPIPRVEVLS